MRISRYLVLLTAFISFSKIAYAQNNLNMILQDSMRYPTGVNDVAGWVDDEGNEYAIVGLNTGVSIVDIKVDPIREVAFIGGPFNIWRDINTFGHYAYVTTEAKAGLLIIDLQYLPDSVKTYIWMDSLPTSTGTKALFQSAHTIWIDEFGIAYLNGSNLNNGGPILIDVATNPTDPDFLGYAPARYSHDVYARDSILYSAEIWAGTVSIYDVHDPQNIQLIGRVTTPNEFTHNAWLSDNSEVMFTTDERANSYVTAYDIRDPGNIIELDRFRQASTDGSGHIPHNVYVWNDWLVVAYYTSGTLIVDAARPDNLIEVGSFDSFLGPDGDFNGVWGSYPFLPSGRILTSDRNSGLYVFIPNYVRAAYLEGTVIDSITREPIQGATVTIQGEEIVLPQTTGFDGGFKTGKGIPGIYNVRIEKQGYWAKTVPTTFINGELLTPVYELLPVRTHTFNGSVIDEEGSGVPFAVVALDGLHGQFTTVADANGNFSIPLVFEGTYAVDAGVWGMTTHENIFLGNSDHLTIQVQDGYRDDFDADLGWTVSGDADSGIWDRGIPSLEYLFTWVCGSPTDSPYDDGKFMYSTGFAPSGNIDENEVSGGTTILASPAMDLETFEEIHLFFDYWLCEFPPNQYTGFTVWMTDGIDTSLLKTYQEESFDEVEWKREHIIIDVLQGPKDNVQILFMASDTTSGQSDYRLKVHIDNFQITESPLSTKGPDASINKMLVYPNPVHDEFIYLQPLEKISGQSIKITIFNLNGTVEQKTFTDPSTMTQGIRHRLPNGIYFLHWRSDQGESGIEKVVVVRNQ